MIRKGLAEGVMMRTGLLVLIWLSILGTIIQVPLLCFEIWLLATGTTFIDLTVWALLTEHIPFLAWVADLLMAIVGAEFGGWILGLPATLVTIVKLILSTLIGIWALNKVREMDSLSEAGGAT